MREAVGVFQIAGEQVDGVALAALAMTEAGASSKAGDPRSAPAPLVRELHDFSWHDDEAPPDGLKDAFGAAADA